MPVGVYFRNDGPGAITFADPSSWSTHTGQPMPRGSRAEAALTPAGSIWFNDGVWSASFAEGVDFLGCIFLYLTPDQVLGRTAHLNFSLIRGSTLHSMRVDVQLR
jgi:hypothetical protein